MVSTCKKTLGRRRIEIKKIEKKTSLQVTFTKRRSSLFRKAGELAVLCNAEIAILIQSPAGNIFTFGHPSVEALIDSFQMEKSPQAACRQVWDDGRSEYEEAVRRLEMEKRRMEENEIGDFWWDEACEGLEVHELEEYLEALEGLRENVLQKLEEKKNQEFRASTWNSSSNLLALTDDDQPADYDLFEFILN